MFEDLKCTNHFVLLFVMEAMCLDRLERHEDPLRPFLGAAIEFQPEVASCRNFLAKFSAAAADFENRIAS